jgi:hypothetical protein
MEKENLPLFAALFNKPARAKTQQEAPLLKTVEKNE